MIANVSGSRLRLNRVAPAPARGARACVSLVVTLLIAFAGVAPVVAQMVSPALESSVRVEWTVDQQRSGRQRVTGYAHNARDMSAVNVKLLVEALDSSGHVVGSTLATVSGEVPPRNRSYFEVLVPPAGASYRVSVRSVDWRSCDGGGGG